MRTNRARVLCVIGWTIAGAACRSDVDETTTFRALQRITPTNVSDVAGWSLFDRSITTGYTPDKRALTVDLARSEVLAAIKVRGGSAYSIEVRGRGGVSLGFPRVNLSTLSNGWHAIASNAGVATNVVELSFVAHAAGASVPELELWTVASETSVGPIANRTVSFAAVETSRQIAAGTCETFHLELTRAPTLFRRMHVAYESVGLFRPFAIERSINGRAGVGGFWLHADVTNPRSVVEEIDPESLTLGTNTLRFCVPAAATAPAMLSEVRVVGELDGGDKHITKVSVGTRDGAAAIDERADTHVALSAGDRMSLELDRLVSPDALVIDAAADVLDVACIGGDGARTALVFEDAGSALRLDGGARACATITVAFASAVSVAEVAVIGSGAGERVDWPRIVVTSPLEHFGTVAWIGGYVARPQQMNGALRVDVDANAAQPTTGEFGDAVKRASDVTADWIVDVAARLSNGTQQLTKVVLAANRAADVVGASASSPTAASVADAARYGAPGATASTDATLLGAAKLRLGTHAGLDIPAGAVLQSTRIQARRLEPATLPPLDPGMVNVTAPKGQAYEFLPHGQRFAKSVEVLVPFDPKLLPDGTTPNDVHTYYYDDNARRWRKLSRNSIDLGDRVLRSATDHFTIMINAVLAVPANPTPLAFDPTSLTSIAAASPGDGIDLIEPPVASSQGDARVGLPIRLPAGRGSYMPSLSIGYSSAGDNGWLGVGWNLAVSRIEIDTRWGVPRYTDNEEPRYLLDGAELVPTLEVEGPTCVGGRRYHTRIEGGYTHILRCGLVPANYYWILHDRDGTRFMYGRDANGNTGNASFVSTRPRPCSFPPCGNGIYRWHLREVLDTYQNKTTFSYQVDDVAGTEPSRAVYPYKIEYTSHYSKPAPYSVEFVLAGTRPDVVVSARGGFKEMTRKLLRVVRVKYESNVIRDYVLTYAHGQFDKTVLSSARVYGVGGCAASADAFTLPSCTGEHREHRFEYYQEPLGFQSLVTPVIVEDDPTGKPEGTRLGKGRSTTFAGTASIALEDTPGGNEVVTVGAHVSGGPRTELIGIYDVNGDGLVDHLFFDEQNKLVSALYNHGERASRFDANGPQVVGLSSMGREHSNGWGVDASLGIDDEGFGATVSAGYSSGTSRASKFFSDLDGDGHLDLVVANGTSLFSAPDGATQRFKPSPFVATTLIDPKADPTLQEVATDIKNRSIPGAPVVRWVAPHAGLIEVYGTVSLINAGSTDGVSVEVYHQNMLIGGWSLISASSPVTFSIPRQVAVGDGIYLRVLTGADDGIAGEVTADEVEAKLVASYTKACADATCVSYLTPYAGKEPTGTPVFEFSSHQEMRVTSVRPLLVPADGEIKLEGIIAKLRSSADLRICFQRFPKGAKHTDYRCDDTQSPAMSVFGTTWWRDQTYAAEDPIAWNFNVQQGDLLVLRAESDYSIDPASIVLRENSGTPKLRYVHACVPDENGCTTTSDPDELEQVPLDHTAFGFYVAPVSPPAPEGALPAPFVADLSCRYFVEPFMNPLGAGVPITVAVRTDKQGTLTKPAPFTCSTICAPQPKDFSLEAGESLSIEITADKLVLPAQATTVRIHCDHTYYYDAPLIFRQKHAEPIVDRTPFAGGYRGWHATFWNERKPFTPTDLLDVYRDPSLLPGCGTPNNVEQCMREQLSLMRTAIEPVPAAGRDANGCPDCERFWAPRNSAASVKENGELNAASIGAVGPPVPDVPTTPDGGVFSNDYARLSMTKSLFVGASVPLPKLQDLGLSLNGTVTRSFIKTTTDVVELTGDGIADVVAGQHAIQGALPGATSSPLNFDFGSDGFRYRKGHDYTINLGATASTPSISAGGRPRTLDVQRPPGGGIIYSTSRGLAVGRNQMTDDLVDINGDGLPDRVQRRGRDINVRYNLGNEFGSWETIATMDPVLADTQIDTFESFEQFAPVVELDSTSNALSHDTTLTQHETKTVNLLFTKITKSSRKTSTRTTRQVADLNGDGLPDLLLKKSGSDIYVQFNRGVDFAPPQPWATPGWLPGTTLSSDFHGAFDPLLKVGNYVVTGDDVLAGGGSLSGTGWSGELVFRIPNTPIAVKVGGSRFKQVDTYELALIDIDGDGDLDHVLRRSQGSDHRLQVKRNQLTRKVNLLKKVSRPLGATIELDYAFRGNTVSMPQQRAVLARVEVNDGVDLGPDFASPNLVTSYGYQDGYYDRLEKQFLGFAKVTTYRPDGGSVEQHYNNRNFTLSGMLTREIRKDSTFATVSERKINLQVLDVTGPLGVLTAHPACIAAQHALLRRIPNNAACTPKAPVATHQEDIQGELGTTTTKTRTTQDTSRDRFGNVLVSLDTGDAAVANDDLYVTAGYQNDTVRWILGRPTSLQVRSGGPTGPLLRARAAVYWDEGRVRELTVQTGTGLATTKLAYDQYGNLERLETPPNTNGETQVYTVAFDPVVATYPVSTSDAFGYTSTAAYDYRFGFATTQTDTNGAELVRTLDGFGRLTAVRGPYDPVGLPALELHYYPTENPPRATATTRTSAPPGYSGPLPPPVHTVTIADGLGRAIELRKTAVVDGIAGMTTTGLVRRDAHGRVTKSWHPFFTAGASTTFVSPIATLATTMEYDELDRVKKTIHPDATFETTSYAIASSPTGPQLFKTRHVIPMSPIDRVREQYVDQLGHTRAHVEYADANTPAVTSYDYTALGELRTIVDAESNVTSVGYDFRGLRTSLANSDTGLREEQFDLMGNRIALIEPNHRANGTQVTYVYERNRLASIDYPSKPSVTFDYGAPGAPDGRAGRLTRMSDETGSIEYSYGALGETRRSLRTFHPAGNPTALYFDHRFTGDSLGRQLQVRYPDGEVVTNVYDAAGMLAEVRGEGDGWQRTYASELRYDVFGNRTRMELGRVVTTWSFEPARVRLDRVTSTIQGGSNAKIQDLVYGYDAAGNPTSIANNLAPLSSASGSMPGASNLTLTYDGVDRLKRIEGSAQLDATRTTTYDQVFAYTPSHNLGAKSRVHWINDGVTPTAPPSTNFSFSYQYSTRPHLPDQVGDLQLQYDPSGNPKVRLDTASGLQQTLVWDDDNRLVQLTDTAGVSQANLYDSSGLRVRRKSTTPNGTRTTIFASPLFDLNGEQASSNGGIKHIFAGEVRIASVLGTFESRTDPVAPGTPGAAYFMHGDHLGSTSVVTDDDGAVHQSVEYFADGEMWIDRAPATPVNGYLFNGKPFDAETGFYDYGQRFYDPRTSLWLGVDPAFTESADVGIGRPLMLSVSAYAANSPARFIDPDGRQPWLPQAEGEWRAIKHTVSAPVRAYNTHVHNRVVGASRLAGGIALAKIGAAICTTGVGCSIGATLITTGVDLASAGAAQILTNDHVQTYVGKTLGPEAEMLQEAAGAGAALYDLAFPIRGPTITNVVADGTGGGGGAIRGGGGPTIPSRIYRGATKDNPNHVKLRPGEDAVSFRDSLSNATGEPPVLKPGNNYIEVDTALLPPGSVHPDGGTIVGGRLMPPGHVSVTATPEEIVKATVGGGKFPKKVEGWD